MSISNKNKLLCCTEPWTILVGSEYGVQKSFGGSWHCVRRVLAAMLLVPRHSPLSAPVPPHGRLEIREDLLSHVRKRSAVSFEHRILVDLVDV